MRFKQNLMDEVQMRRTIIRMSHEIIERNRGMENTVLIGIQRRGLPIAKEIAQIIKAVEGKDIPVGTLDIALYRDDLSKLNNSPLIKNINLPFSVNDANIILVDDVLYTGRTVRAAMDALSKSGSPKTIQLAVLIDRGSRELPIGANFIGKSITLDKSEVVIVSVKEIDENAQVDIYTLD